MMIHARMAQDGSLSDIGHREAQHPDDVPLDAMPEGFGPFAVDPQDSRRAVRDEARVGAQAKQAAEGRAINLEVRRAAAERLGLTDAADRLEAEVSVALKAAN